MKTPRKAKNKSVPLPAPRSDLTGEELAGGKYELNVVKKKTERAA